MSLVGSVWLVLLDMVAFQMDSWIYCSYMLGLVDGDYKKIYG